MSSLSSGLPRNRSFDSSTAGVSPRQPWVWPPQSQGRAPASPPANITASPVPPAAAQTSATSPQAPAPAAPAAGARKTLTIAVDAEALMQVDASAVFRPNAALMVVKKFLKLNDGAQEGTPRVEMVLLCHLPGKQRRLLIEALRAAELPIERVLFTRERALHAFLKPFEAMLYLSCDPTRARSAVMEGIAAGCLLAKDAEAPTDVAHPARTLRVAFDFDGVLADDLSQQRFDAEGLDAFHAHEDSARDTPMGPGPAQPLALALGTLRDELAQLRATGAEVPCDIRIGVVTARGSVAIARLFRTLEAWNFEPDDVFCLAGHDKTPFISGLETDLYIDDDAHHAARARNVTLAVHMPTRSSLLLS